MLELLIETCRWIIIGIVSSYLIWPFFRRFHSSSKFVDEYNPQVTVIVAAHNEEKTIENCIRALLKNKYNKKEIIVVDDGSTDDTSKAVSKHSEVRLITIKRSGRSAAINCGLKHSSGEVALITDADSVMETDWIQKMVRHFADPEVGLVAGPTLGLQNKKPTLIQKFQYLYNYVIFNWFKICMDSINGLFISSGASTAIRRSLLSLSGYFNEGLSSFENIDITLRIIKKTGHKARFDSEAIVRSDEPKKTKAFFSRHRRWFNNLYKMILPHSDVLFNASCGTVGFITYPLFMLQTLGLVSASIPYITLIILSSILSQTLSGEIYFILYIIILFSLVFFILSLLALREVNELSREYVIMSLLWPSMALYYFFVTMSSMLKGLMRRKREAAFTPSRE